MNVIRAGKDDGRIVMAGPLGDPPHGAAIVFKDRAAAEAFPESDPYVATAWSRTGASTPGPSSRRAAGRLRAPFAARPAAAPGYPHP